MSHKKLEQIAEQIFNLEQQMLKGKSIQSNEHKIENIMESLTFEEMLEIDEIIMKKFLTK